MSSCKEVSYLVSRSHDERLSLAERWRVRAHLWYCVGCRRFARHVAFVRQAARQLTYQQDLVLSAAARARIRRGLGANR